MQRLSNLSAHIQTGLAPLAAPAGLMATPAAQGKVYRAAVVGLGFIGSGASPSLPLPPPCKSQHVSPSLPPI